MTDNGLLQTVTDWFASRSHTPLPFQLDAVAAQIAGESGLIHAPTGTGKTLAAASLPLLRIAARRKPAGLRLLWLTPLRALARDTTASLAEPLAELGSPARVELRTSDVAGSVKTRQEKTPPQVLVTTPESLCLLLTRAQAPKFFGSLELVVVDEWHELMGSKRGVLTELALERLRAFRRDLPTWGLSATLGNLDEALCHLLGYENDRPRPGRLIKGELPKQVVVDAVLPEPGDKLPWGGHMGLSLVSRVVQELESCASALIFTNTRSQCELWHQALLDARPDWAGLIGLHHGSLDREERRRIEHGLKTGGLRAVVATSSLDLGVDFAPVERVLQVGSPKGVARLLQRAGRSGHGPGRPSRVTVVPAHAMELVETAAARTAAGRGEIEARRPLPLPLDVLAQHMVTVASGTGFRADALYDEVRQAASYHELTREQFDWTLDFTAGGGATLAAYPEYRKLARDKDGLYRPSDPAIARRHRMSIGTILADAAVTVRFMRGKTLGAVEESFISRLKPGDSFIFAGRALTLVQVRDMVAYVRTAKKASGPAPVWLGGRMPLSTELCSAVRDRLDEAADGVLEGAEMERAWPLLDVQERWSAIPRKGELLVEKLATREGRHLFIYPFAGRLAHEGLAALFAYRLSRLGPISFSWSINDYGLELLSPTEADFEGATAAGLFSPEHVVRDILATLSEADLVRSTFREISRVAGLVFQGYPGKSKTSRQIQATSSLLYDVFTKYDPHNMLLDQARREVLERQLETRRIIEALTRMSTEKLVVTTPKRVTPFGFPLFVDRLREKLSSESLVDRLERLTKQLTTAAERS